MLFILSLLIAYFGLYLLFLKYIKKIEFTKSNLLIYTKKFIFRIFISISVWIALIASFIIYQNKINPVELKTYTLINEKENRIIKFQEMAHLASPSFYETVKNRIKETKSNSWVLYFEWVKPANNPENLEKFNSLMWIKFWKETYKELNLLYGLKAQNNEEFLNLINDKDYQADVSFDDIINYFEENKYIIKDFKDSESIDISPILKEFKERYGFALSFIQLYNKSLINFMVKHQSLREFVMKQINKEDFFDIIINYRSEHLAKEIVKNKSDKDIFIIYGMEHYKSFLEYLNKLDGNNWKEINMEKTQLIKE